MGKVALLTGAPGTGKSTLRRGICEHLPKVEAFDYGELLRRKKESTGLKLTYEELRQRSGSVITASDVVTTDDWIIDRAAELRATSDVVIDSHAVTAEQYGLRAIPFSSLHLNRLSLDGIIVLRCDADVLTTRVEADSRGRRVLGVQLVQEMQLMQESVALAYSVACGCAIYIIDTTRIDPGEVLRCGLQILTRIGFINTQ